MKQWYDEIITITKRFYTCSSRDTLLFAGKLAPRLFDFKKYEETIEVEMPFEKEIIPTSLSLGEELDIFKKIKQP